MPHPLALIVDDEPDIRELLEITLGRMNIDTRSAENLVSAKGQLQKETFDLCLTDMRLPDGNGIELIELINQQFPQLPVAMITAHGNMESAILALIDFDHQLLPDSIVIPGLWGGLIVSLFGLFTDTQSAIIGAVAGYLSLWTVFHLFRLLTGKEGMGYGDFKLLALFGAWLGWQYLLQILLLSSLVGALVGIALILFRGRDRTIPIPFGPYLATAGWISLLWGDLINNAYLQWAGLG